MSLDPSALPSTTTVDVQTLVERRGPLEPVFATTVLWFALRAVDNNAPQGRLTARHVLLRAGGTDVSIAGGQGRPAASEQALLVRDLGGLVYFMLMSTPPWGADSFDDTASVGASATAAVQAKLLQGPSRAKAAPLLEAMSWALEPSTLGHTLSNLLVRIVAAPRLDRLPTDLFADVRVGMIVAGRYELLRVVGAGAMASVFAARRLDAGPTAATEVAIKVIEDREGGGGPLSDQRLRRRLARELRGFAKVDHPNVVSPVEAGFDDALEAPYLVMELLSGEDLASKIDKAGPLDWRVAAALFKQAAAGLGAAHRAGLIHRDIKPANLFVHETAGGAVLKVCDFGLARTIVDLDPAAATRSGVMLGSPAYMSPEQIASARRADARSDVWSLGVSLYESLTGVLPWRVKGMGALLAAVSKGEKVPLSVAAPAVPSEMVALVNRMLSVDAAARPASMDEVGAALEAMLPSAKRPRRKIVWVAASSLVAASALGLVIGAIHVSKAPPKKSSPRTSAAVSAAAKATQPGSPPNGCEVPDALLNYRVRGLSLRTIQSRIKAAGYSCFAFRLYAPEFGVVNYQSSTAQSCFANIMFGPRGSIAPMITNGRPHREDEQHSYAFVVPAGCPNALTKEDILRDE